MISDVRGIKERELMISGVTGIKERELWDGVPSGPVGAGVPKRGTVTEFQKKKKDV
jgi:hypothetical protein